MPIPSSGTRLVAKPWRSRAALVAAIILSLLTVPGLAPASAAPKPAVFPTPQSSKVRPETVKIPSEVALVAGAADAATLNVVRAALKSAGARTIRDDASGRPQLTVFASRNADALRALSVQDSTGIAAEGYVLAAGTGSDGTSRIVLDGVDAAGGFYAAQTLRQLLTGPSLRGVEIRDWPSLQWRGVVEGFYGPPWSHEERLSQLDYYGRNKMNIYVYTPKDDPYLRAEWRQPYPAEQVAQLKTLVERAQANHVEFSYVLSPGLSVCFSRPSEADALISKFESLHSIGVRTFVVAFDDIDYERWHCDEDRTRFGTGAAAAGAAQAHLLNVVQRDFIATHPGTAPLQLVPTEYWNIGETGYKRVISDDLDPSVVVQWTGLDVIAPTITKADVANARRVFNHPILLWDNYPVNDYVPGRLLLGPFVGREPGLSASTIGLTANPMPQAQASRTSLFTVADYSWNDTGYNPARSWAAGLADLAEGDARTTEALRAFADVNYSSRLDNRPAPELTAALNRFWPAWSTGDSGSAESLRRALKQVHDAPAVLRDRMDNPRFLAETELWLDATQAWGEAALTALDLLTAQRAGDGERAWKARRALPDLVKHAKSFTWVGLDPNRKVPVELDSTLDTFVRDAVAESQRWLGVTEIKPVTNLPLLDDRFPTTAMTDGDPTTYFWGATGAQPGHHIGVDLGAARPVSGVEVLMGKSDSPDDYIHAGVVEYSADGTTWTAGPAFSGTAEVRLDLPAGATARFVRLRATAGQGNWVVVREFTVRRGDQPTVSGAPAPAVGSAFARAVDEQVTTHYEAARAPAAGEALTVTLPKDRPLSAVTVLQAGAARADVQVRVGTRWVKIGALSGAHTELPAKGRTADAIRLAWASGSPQPTITEIIPAYDDAPLAAIITAPTSLNLDAGNGAAVSAKVTATRIDDVPVTVEAAPPAGITVTPARRSFTLRRGAEASVPLQVETAAGLATGTYQVPVKVSGQGKTVSTTVAVTVWPRTTATNVALASNGGVATASQVEDDLPQFAAGKAIDGDTSTRWSSPWSDNQWLQAELAQPQRVGRVVLRWEAAHASAYEIRTSADGVTWTTAATVPDSKGGVETVRLDAPNTRFVRMQGLGRATGFGYSLYELEVYPVAP